MSEEKKTLKELLKYLKPICKFHPNNAVFCVTVLTGNYKEPFPECYTCETGKLLVRLDGLAAELQDDKHKTLPTHEEIQEMIGDPLGMKLNFVFLDGFQSGWFNHTEKVLGLLGAEQT